MPISPEQFNEMERRTQKNRRQTVCYKCHHNPCRCQFADEIPVKDEITELHDEIIKWCNSQWPRVVYIHANPAAPATIQPGCQDFTLFYNGKCICIECKSRTGKMKKDQTIWAHEMRKQGFEVHVIRSMAEFHATLQTYFKFDL